MILTVPSSKSSSETGSDGDKKIIGSSPTTSRLGTIVQKCC